MANLSDLLDAINRLHDRLGNPAEVANTLNSPIADSGPSQASSSESSRVSALGESISKQIGDNQTIKDIANSLKSLNQNFRNLSSRQAATQPATGQATKPSSGSPSSAFDFIATIASRGLGNVPIVGTAIRQTIMAKQLIQGVHRYAAEAKTVGNIKSAHNSAAVGVAAKAVGVAAKTVGTPSAMGAIPAIAGMILPLLANPIGMIAATVVIVTGALLAVAGAVVCFAEKITEANRAISGYSPQMAASFAISDLKGVFRDMKSAQARAGSQSRYTLASDDFADKFRPIKDRFFNAIEDTATVILRLINPILDVINAFNNLINWIGSKLVAIGGAALNAVGAAGNWLLNNVPGGGLVRSAAGAAWGGVKWAGGKIANAWNWAASPNAPAGSATGAGGGGFASSSYGQVMFKGIANITAAIDDAVKTMKDLNDTMKSASGDQNYEALTAGQFMAGIVAAPSAFGRNNRNFKAQVEVWNRTTK